MNSNPDHFAHFQLYDVSDYPIIRLDSIAMPKGHAAQWMDEMDTLLKIQHPFVLIFLNTIKNDLREDKKARIDWIKKNKQALATLCCGFITIEANKTARSLKRAQGAAISAVFGLRLKYAASLQEAEALARCLLNGEDATDVDGE